MTVKLRYYEVFSREITVESLETAADEIDTRLSYEEIIEYESDFAFSCAISDPDKFLCGEIPEKDYIIDLA